MSAVITTKTRSPSRTAVTKNEMMSAAHTANQAPIAIR